MNAADTMLQSDYIFFKTISIKHTNFTKDRTMYQLRNACENTCLPELTVRRECSCPFEIAIYEYIRVTDILCILCESR